MRRKECLRRFWKIYSKGKAVSIVHLKQPIILQPDEYIEIGYEIKEGGVTTSMIKQPGNEVLEFEEENQ